MRNGKPHDHPLTDILVHGIPVYGEEADGLIRRIASLCSHMELYEWWVREIGQFADEDTALGKAQLRLSDLLQRAKESGEDVRS